MAVIFHNKSGKYYTGEGWSDDSNDAKVYKSDDSAQKAISQHNMSDCEIQPDPTKEDDDATSPGVHEA
jgi:hypothetical protein